MRWTGVCLAAVLLAAGTIYGSGKGAAVTYAAESHTQGAVRGTPLRWVYKEGFQPVLEWDILAEQNLLRENMGLAPLVWDEQLAQAAYQRAQELSEYDYFAHTRPDGASWHTVLRQDVPVDFERAGENLAEVSYNGKADLGFDSGYWVQQWENSKSHYGVMTDGGYTRGGVAVYYSSENGVHHLIAVALYAR